jgi:beta-glucanase (GH16 family)
MRTGATSARSRPRRRSAWVAVGVTCAVLALVPLALTLARDSDAGRSPVTPAALRTSTVGTAGPPSVGWDLVFGEEFDEGRLDAGTWHTCHWWAPTTCTIETHGELGLYRPENVSVADGVLRLQARREPAVGWNGKDYGYTTGMVSTGGSAYSAPVQKPGFVFRYGYAEARVRIPAGQGLVPAFWLAPDDHSWPPEIDAMEIVGDSPNLATMHFHYNRPNGTRTRVGNEWAGPDFSAGWHTFAVDWRPGSLTWFIDGVERSRFADPRVTDKPAYLLLTLAVGGQWPGPPDTRTAFPADYLVDYVRVYQQRADMSVVSSLGPAR